MDVTDPQEAYDDLHVTQNREVLDAEEFADSTRSEAATVGWLLVGYVFDEAGRMLLVDEPWADGWKTPAGVLDPGETLAEAAVREIREETGVEATPVRPHAVDEVTFENEATGATDGWTAVHFELAAETTALDDDPGLADEEIDDVRWFEGLPEDLFGPELTTTVYERCRGNDPGD
jgi:ADP-ribose pyrophosphatase YjhB (NUDIX family)